MLDRIHIEGFMSLSDVEMELGDTTVLVGPNGAGKSNLVQAFSLLGSMIRGELGSFVRRAGGAYNLLHRGKEPTDTISFDLSFHAGQPHLVNGYKAVLEPDADDNLFFRVEGVTFHDTHQYSSPMEHGPWLAHTESKLSGTRPSDRVVKWMRTKMEEWTVFHFHDTSSSSPMKRKHDIDDNEQLRPDGANLAALLYRLRESHPHRYQQILDTIRQVAPFLDDFRLRPDRIRDDKIQLEWVQKDSSGYFNANSLSDGTLRFLAIATLILQPDLPSVILIDEPELGLHPFAIHQLAELVQTCESQVILSTQSVTLLDQFALDDIVVVENHKGSSELSRPNPDELQNWLESYSVGDLWQKNLIGGRPIQR